MRIITLAFLLLFNVIGNASADDFTFIITAHFSASSCTVSISTMTFNLYINDIDLQTPGSRSDWQALPGQTIGLYNCFNDTHTVEASVSGVPDDDDKDGFKNQSTTNPATGVSVQLKSGEQMLHNNDVITVKLAADNTARIPLAARLYSAKGNVIAGDVYSVINLTISYN